MNERPVGVADAEVAAALREHWGGAVTLLEYLPVGYGGYHWGAAVADGRRFFVTLSHVADDDGFADLAATMEATATLADNSQLSFMVGPVRTDGGDATARLRPEWAVTVTPFSDGEPGRWSDELSLEDRAEVISMLASLHGCDAPAGIPVRSPELSGRHVVEALLGERSGSWADVGPYGEPARKLIAGHTTGLRKALGRFDDLVSRAAASGALVLIHGEPHPGNLIRRNGSFLLIDWDTAGLALPERDLWSVLPDPATDLDGYAALGNLYTRFCGRTVNPAAMTLYRLRWDLEEICLFLAEFGAPHEQTADTQVAWAGLTDAVLRVTQPLAGVLPAWRGSP